LKLKAEKHLTGDKNNVRGGDREERLVNRRKRVRFIQNRKDKDNRVQMWQYTKKGKKKKYKAGGPSRCRKIWKSQVQGEVCKIGGGEKKKGRRRVPGGPWWNGGEN